VPFISSCVVLVRSVQVGICLRVGSEGILGPFEIDYKLEYSRAPCSWTSLSPYFLKIMCNFQYSKANTLFADRHLTTCT
jgi:hypothetical protein